MTELENELCMVEIKGLAFLHLGYRGTAGMHSIVCGSPLFKL
jgi:hypothetical protein